MKLAELRKKAKKEDPKKTFKQRVRDIEAPFLRESVNIMADWLAMAGK